MSAFLIVKKNRVTHTLTAGLFSAWLAAANWAAAAVISRKPAAVTGERPLAACDGEP